MLDTRVDTLKETIVRLGFKSEREYFRSSLYRIIREEVLKRDSGKCRRLSCTTEEEPVVVFLNHPETVLLGICPALAVSICKTCLTELTIDDPEPKHFAAKLLLWTTGLRKTTRVSDYRVGQWYKTIIRENQDLARSIYEKLSLSLPGYTKRVEKVLTPYYRKYLGLG